MSIDALAGVYHVGRSTAARWLADARERLLAGTRDALCAELQIGRAEYESLAALMRSHVAVSVVRLLDAMA